MMRCQTEDGCLSRSMTIKLVKGVCTDEASRDSQHVTLHVRLTRGDQGFHQRRCAHEDVEEYHADQRSAPREGARRQRCLRFSARGNIDLKDWAEQPVVISELVFDMMLYSEFEVTDKSSAFYTIPS